jgi:hypothetical protein
MKVLVVSEGKQEQSGALENLLRRLGGADQHFDHGRMARSDIPRVHGGKPVPNIQLDHQIAIPAFQTMRDTSFKCKKGLCRKESEWRKQRH